MRSVLREKPNQLLSDYHHLLCAIIALETATLEWGCTVTPEVVIKHDDGVIVCYTYICATPSSLEMNGCQRDVKYVLGNVFASVQTRCAYVENLVLFRENKMQTEQFSTYV